MDYKVVKCNYATATNVARKGAVAYIRIMNYGNGNDRVVVVVRSRSGRWIDKWESIERLENFRVVTLPPEHTLRNKPFEVGIPESDMAVVERDCEALKNAKCPYLDDNLTDSVS